VQQESANVYDLPHVAEVYDQYETANHDVEFLLELARSMDRPRILEPFCGTGRILIPLVEAGYEVVGMDIAAGMLQHLRAKLAVLDPSVQERARLIQADVLTAEWPTEFDLVILGGNCLYELAAPEEQQQVIGKAYAALKRGGLLFVDNDNMEGLLPASWCDIGVEKESFPTGECPHGVKIRGYTQTLWVDRQRRLWKARRRIELIYPDGETEELSWVQQKHPVSADEVQAWLEAYGFQIVGVYAGTGERKGFTPGAKRATFLARK